MFLSIVVKIIDLPKVFSELRVVLCLGMLIPVPCVDLRNYQNLPFWPVVPYRVGTIKILFEFISSFMWSYWFCFQQWKPYKILYIMK